MFSSCHLLHNNVEHKRLTDPEFELSGHKGFDDEMAELLVPDGHNFVMGDNHWRSIDSRLFGAVPSELVHGKVIGVTEHFAKASQN